MGAQAPVAVGSEEVAAPGSSGESSYSLKYWTLFPWVPAPQGDSSCWDVAFNSI